MAIPHVVPGLHGDPAAYELAYREAVRAIDTQNASLDGLRTRAGIVLSGAALAAGLLGSRATTGPGWSLPAGLSASAGVLLVAAVLLSTYLLLGIHNWRPSVDVHKLLADYVEADPPASLAEIQRSLAYYMQEDWLTNADELQKRNRYLVVAAAAVASGTAILLIASHA